MKKPQPPPEYVFRKRQFSLTDREKEVLQLIARGHSYRETGEQLGITPKTVNTYLQKIREKFRLRTRSDLVTLAIREGLLKQ